VAWLIQQGLLKHVITQNCDGLHRLSGVPTENLSELHGNIFVEYCKKCEREYERKQDVTDDDASTYYEELEEHGRSNYHKPKAVQCDRCRLTHQTKRKCRHCKNPLFDTIINFGDILRPCHIAPATLQTSRADVILVLGSTLMVTSAADLCKVKEEQKLVICNRQRTEHDDRASIRVHGDCDHYMKLVMMQLMGKVKYDEWEKGRVQRLFKDNMARKSR
jgi:NAD-dependent SIR2 family protein deacetylase